MKSKKFSRRTILALILLIVTALLFGLVRYLWATPEQPAEIILLQK